MFNECVYVCSGGVNSFDTREVDCEACHAAILDSRFSILESRFSNLESRFVVPRRASGGMYKLM